MPAPRSIATLLSRKHLLPVALLKGRSSSSNMGRTGSGQNHRGRALIGWEAGLASGLGPQAFDGLEDANPNVGAANSPNKQRAPRCQPERSVAAEASQLGAQQTSKSAVLQAPNQAQFGPDWRALGTTIRHLPPLWQDPAATLGQITKYASVDREHRGRSEPCLETAAAC
jgi:hypothetical protein